MWSRSGFSLKSTSPPPGLAVAFQVRCHRAVTLLTRRIERCHDVVTLFTRRIEQSHHAVRTRTSNYTTEAQGMGGSGDAAAAEVLGPVQCAPERGVGVEVLAVEGQAVGGRSLIPD